MPTITKLSVNFAELRKAEGLCSKIQYELHNVNADYPERLQKAKALYRELGAAIKLSGMEYKLGDGRA
jgi:hypothetical protein